MSVAELVEKLRQLPQDLEVHIMADLESDLVDIDSVHLITKPFIDEPFVVIEVKHHRGENRSSEIQAAEDIEDTARKNGDSPPTPKQ